MVNGSEFLGSDRFLRQALGQSGSGFDFDKDNSSFILENQVDLARAKAVVLGQEMVAFILKEFFG